MTCGFAVFEVVDMSFVCFLRQTKLYRDDVGCRTDQ